MDEGQTIVLPLKAAYAFGASHGLEDEVREIRDMVIEWDSSYTSSLRRGYVVDQFEKKGVFAEFKAKCWANGNTVNGETQRRRYLRIKAQYEIFLATGHLPEGEAEGPEGGEDGEFAMESELRDYLAKNLGRIEPGLCLYKDSNRTGVEFPIEGGYIDILAMDRNKRYVVIELKVSKGRNKAVGQILYYMGWVDKNLRNGPCRGMIIAKEIPEDLVLAIRRAQGISLYRYALSVRMEPVSAGP